MISRFLFLAFVAAGGLGLAACDATGPEFSKLVPDDTPFIVSTLEFSPDTLYHHAQVYVARVTDLPDYRLFDDPERNVGNEVWNPTMWAQVAWKLDDLGLAPEPEPEAAVSITGPLGQPNEQNVALAYERDGVYGDLAGQLSVEPEQRYRLDVVYPDGSAYTAETRVPRAAEVDLPAVVDMPLELQRGEHGYIEQNVGREPMTYPCEEVEGASLSVFKRSQDRWIDAVFFVLEDDESFFYEDRGDDYVRGPRTYFIDTNGQNYDTSRCSIAWLASPNILPQPLGSVTHFARYLQVGAELGPYYEREFLSYGFRGAEDGSWRDPYQAQSTRELDAVASGDPAYAFSISNITKRAPDGSVLPRSQTDAIGVFGGYSARYLRSTVRLVRDWDPCDYGWDCSAP
jgi:hypothetical protein